MGRLLSGLISEWTKRRTSRAEQKLKQQNQFLNETVHGLENEIRSLQGQIQILESERDVIRKENKLLASSFEVSRVYVDTLITQHGFKLGVNGDDK